MREPAVSDDLARALLTAAVEYREHVALQMNGDRDHDEPLAAISSNLAGLIRDAQDAGLADHLRRDCSCCGQGWTFREDDDGAYVIAACPRCRPDWSTRDAEHAAVRSALADLVERIEEQSELVDESSPDASVATKVLEAVGEYQRTSAEEWASFLQDWRGRAVIAEAPEAVPTRTM